ncbi:nucleotidyltransferase family protein [Asticcacaulis taihuensis]|uniref:nucleotidyltransferase family protein n=1 Tax=Asticcacaulis taihuensis TaxID=260084 RepID=UPI0026EA1317|nr:nucleotidyltransferase family protein [Asticcacaulis taihuensis]
MKRFSAVVLAAGASRRFGEDDKLCADLDGKAVISHVLDGLAVLDLGEVLVVVRAPMEGMNYIVNLRLEAGMGHSLALGVAALKPCDGAFIVLADMPLIVPDLYREMADALPGHDIVVPVHNGQNGHPVLFSFTCFDDLRRLSGDHGARDLLRSGRYRLRHIETGGFILADIDTPEDLNRLKIP